MKFIHIQISCGERAEFSSAICKTFNLQANTIAFLYQRFVDKKTMGLSKITVDLLNERDFLSVGNYKDLEGISWIHKSFDFEKYFSKSKLEQRKLIIETAHEAILQMCSKFELDKTPFENAYNKVIENNYTNKYYFKKPTLSKSRKHKAGIEVDMSENGTDINIVFTDTEGTILARKSVFKTHSHFYFIHQLINSGKWIDNERYMASNKKKNVNFIASLNSNKIELDIQPKEKEKEIVEKLNELRYTK